MRQSRFFPYKEIVFILYCTGCFFQNAKADSIPRLTQHHLSVNLAAAAISGELGTYYDCRLSKHLGFQLSYGYRFYSFNMILNGGEGPGISYLAQQGNIFRAVLKRYFTFRDSDMPPGYLLFRLGYWGLHTPTYISRHGSNGLNTTPREVLSVDKHVLNAGFGVGKEIHFKSHFFIDLFASLGVSVGQKKLHKYYYGDSNPYRYKYPDNTIEKKLSLFPTIEFGFKTGFWL